MDRYQINGGGMSLLCFRVHWLTEELSRFFTAIFLHAGLVHLALNMLGQWTLCGQVEQEMGSPSFLVLYLASGIFGNVLGGNFALVGIPSVSPLSP